MRNQVDMAAVTEAFADFRRVARAELGGVVYTRQNFLCCGGCASSALNREAMDANGKFIDANGKGRQRQVVGAVYYHNQDAQRVRNGGPLMLGYGGITLAGNADDRQTLKIGRLMVDALRKRGLEVVWDGNITSRIEVAVSKEQ